MSRVGFEPTTLGLKVRCSDQTELPAQGEVSDAAHCKAERGLFQGKNATAGRSAAVGLGQSESAKNAETVHRPVAHPAPSYDVIAGHNPPVARIVAGAPVVAHHEV